jgi:ATP-dependent DNA ligase
MRFFYPNRPTLVPPDPINPLKPQPDYINSLEASGKYIGEFKWNGDNATIDTTDMLFYNRQGQPLHYTPHEDLLKELSVFPKGCLLNGELMHRHTKNVKDLLILHAVMVWEDKPLYGKTWDDSRMLLVDPALSLEQTDGTRLDYDRHLLLATDYEEGFWDMFQVACECDDSIEGIVLKNPKGKFQIYANANPVSDVSWMLKIRKPSKKYKF